MECSTFIEHVVTIEHFLEHECRNFSLICSNVDITSGVQIYSGSLCYINRAYIFPVQFLLGISGNLLIISVLNRKSMRSITNYFLSCMAAADLGFFLSLSLSSAVAFPNLRDSVHFKHFYYHAYPYLLMCANFFSAVSLWSAVGVTAERFVAVRHPLKVRFVFTRKRLLFASLITCVVSLLLSSSKIFHGTKILHPKGCSAPLHQNNPWNLNIMLTLFLTFLVFTPVLLIIVFNFCLVLALRKSARKIPGDCGRAGILNGRNKNDRKIAILVMMTTISCVILNAPSVIIGALKIKYGFDWFTTEPSIIIPLSNLLVGSDKTLHFFFYYCCSSKFRDGLTSMFSHSKDSFKKLKMEFGEIHNNCSRKPSAIRNNSRQSCGFQSSSRRPSVKKLEDLVHEEGAEREDVELLI